MCWSSRSWVEYQTEREVNAVDPVTTAGHLRVSDADREAVIARLRTHTADGRLSLDDFEVRLDEVMAARTGAELRAVLRELPPLAGDVARRHRRSVAAPVRALVFVAALIGLISLAVGQLVLWPLIPLAFFVLCGRHHHHPHRRHWESPRPVERDDAVTLV